jgi:lipoprotein signal peptidase
VEVVGVEYGRIGEPGVRGKATQPIAASPRNAAARHGDPLCERRGAAARYVLLRRGVAATPRGRSVLRAPGPAEVILAPAGTAMPEAAPTPIARALRRFIVDDVLRFATLLAVAVFVIDWATKTWALQHLYGASVPLGSLTLGVERNTAFAFSAGEGRFTPEFIIAARFAALVVLITLSRRVVTANRRFAAGFALLLAGGCGNAADMAFRDGAVVDFIGAGPFAFAWASGVPFHIVFNVADLAVLFGLLLIAPVIRTWALEAQRWLSRVEQQLLERIAS